MPERQDDASKGATLTSRAETLQAAARLRAVVFEDQALATSLAAIFEPTAFIARAAAHGIDRGGDELADLLGSASAGPARLTAADAATLPPPWGWLPLLVEPQGSIAEFQWAYLGDLRLTDPTYEQTLAQARFAPLNRLLGFRTPVADLPHWAARLPPVRPSGLIFHMSRCGSTLAAQMLAASPANVVVSEASPIDAIVRLDRPMAERAALLRQMIGVLGQTRQAGETHCFLKLDCWHTLALPLFRAAFPDTPWVFLYRNPAEVMVSHLRQAGSQMIPQILPPDVYGIAWDSGAPREDYFARVLGAICGAAARALPSGGGQLINYDELPRAMRAKVLPHFGIAPTTADVSAMAHAARFDAKSPGARFTSDAEVKRRATTDAVVSAVERHVAHHHAELERLRRAAGAPNS